MELRRNQHLLHHISAIKGGKVVKTLNVTKGRPTLSFKELSTILNNGSNTHTIPLADRSSHNLFDPKTAKSEEELFNGNCTGGSSDRRSHDSDDSFTGEFTLRQLKKKCKANKGKKTRLGTKEVEQDNRGSHSDEDYIDLTETLGSLKRKVSGKWKSRKMRKFKSVLSITDVEVKCEPVSFDEDSMQVDSGFDTRVTLKMKDSASVSSLCQEDEMASSDKVLGEILLSGESNSIEEDSLIIEQGTNVAYADSMFNDHHTPANYVSPEIADCEPVVMVVNDQGIIEKLAIGLPDANCCSSRKGSSLIVEEHKDSSLNQLCHGEALKVGDSEMASTCKVIAEMQVTGESCTAQKDSVITVQETDVTYTDPEIPASEEVMVVNNQGIIEMIAPIRFRDAHCCSPRKKSSIVVEEHKDCTLNQICSELEDHPGDSCVPSESTSHEKALKVRDPAMAAEQPISIPALTQEDNAITDALICNESPDILFNLCKEGACSTMDDKKDTSVNISPNSVLNRKTRKTISPDSQQKLCMAMKSLDLPDHKKTEKCKQRLCFEKQEVNADASSDELLTRPSAPEHLNTADTSPNSEHKKKKGKEDKKRIRSKGVNKVPPPAWYRISSACGCIQSCSQNVIDFSQQQMTDTERLAVNLTKELRVMKDLMIEMLHPQGRRASTSRNNINEVRVAVENATKVEDMARRCLAGMTRDCNRFCKIVSLAEKNTVAGNDANSAENIPDKEEAFENDATKGKKKIKFADESGGSLCNVKLIEDLDSTVENGEVHTE